MKILLASDAFMPMVNGVVASTLTLYKELKKRGNDVRILALSKDGKEKAEGDFYYLKSFRINVYPEARVNVAIKNSIIDDIIKWNPDIIHTQTEFTVLLAAKRIAAKLNCAHIHTYHTLYEDYTNFLISNKKVNKKVVGKLSEHFLNKLDGVVAPTYKTFKILENYGVNIPMCIIPTGIDLSRFKKPFGSSEEEKLREKYAISMDTKIMLYLGRISEEKNIYEILNYIAKDKKFFKDKIFLIAGGGPYLDELKKICRSIDIEKYVRFTGMINPKDTYKYYKMADLFCTSSTSETQGLTYIESLASGTPIVCRYDDCIKNIVKENITGYTYNSYSEFAKGINSALSKSNDLSFKINCMKAAEEYSSEVFGESIEKFYTKVLSEKEYKVRHRYLRLILKG